MAAADFSTLSNASRPLRRQGLILAERLFGEHLLPVCTMVGASPTCYPVGSKHAQVRNKALTVTFATATAQVTDLQRLSHRRPQRGSADALTVACAIATIAQVLISVKTGLML